MTTPPDDQDPGGPDVAVALADLDTRTIIERLLAVKQDVGAVGKTGRNESQNYDFRGIDSVLNATHAALIRHGVLVIPHRLASAAYAAVEVGAKRTLSRECTVKVVYRFTCATGHLDVEVPGEALDSGDKATAKAMSVALRIALLQSLTLPTSEPDPDAQSYERSPTPEPPPLVATDVVWLANFRDHVNAATSEEALRAAWSAVGAAVAGGKCSPVDGNALRGLIHTRRQELAAAAPPPAVEPTERPAP